MSERKEIIDISKGRWWEADGYISSEMISTFLIKRVGLPLDHESGENQIEKHYSGGIILRDRRELSLQEGFPIYEIIFKPEPGDRRLLNHSIKSIMKN